jgi:hypothetical protein
MLLIPIFTRSAMRRSMSTLPSPSPWYAGSTTTSHIMAWNTLSPVALANPISLLVSVSCTHVRACVFCNALKSFAFSRCGNDTCSSCHERTVTKQERSTQTQQLSSLSYACILIKRMCKICRILNPHKPWVIHEYNHYIHSGLYRGCILPQPSGLC